MRLFVAVELPDAVKDQLAALETDIPGATWVRPSTLHLTLRFLGDRIDPIRLTPIKTVLASVQADPFEIVLRGVGRFPTEATRPARVLWVGLVPQPALNRLQAAVEQAVAQVGFPPEDHPYRPHITLARLKGDSPLDSFLEQHRAFRADPFTVRKFHLVASQLSAQGSIYRNEASFSL